MLRLEARIPLSGSAVDTFFGRGTNYLLDASGLTATIRSQLASASVPLERTDVANPFIQVFKKPGLWSDSWTVQYTGWIDGSSTLALGDIQNRWTNAIVQSMIQAGLQMSAAEIRAAIDQGFSKYAPERLRTPSGAPNFAPLDNPGNGFVLVYNNVGASGGFIRTPLPNLHTDPVTNGGSNDVRPNPNPNTPARPVPGGIQPTETPSRAGPLLAVCLLVAGAIYLGTRDE